MLARAMSGSYVNFGVFELYGDRALKVRGLSGVVALQLTVEIFIILGFWGRVPTGCRQGAEHPKPLITFCPPHWADFYCVFFGVKV
jgi:hypothetical protein